MRRSNSLVGKFLASILGLGFLFTVSGCATQDSALTALEKRLQQQHRFDDLRYSTEREEGLTPTGVWQVRGDRNVVYLAGTTHLVTTNQSPFPSTFYAAYKNSGAIYVEMDTKSPKFSMIRLTLKIKGWIQKNREQFFYPSGQSLADELSPETLAHLESHFQGKNKAHLSMRPAFVIFMIEASSMGEQMEEVGGVEDVFTAHARKDKKPIGELDDSSVTEVALLALDEMIYEAQRDILRLGPDKAIQTAITGVGDQFDDTSWRSGDLATIQIEIDELRGSSPDLYERILPQRNRAWLPKIRKALTGDTNVMFLAGIAHFAGADGLIALLEREGYHVQQLYGFDQLAGKQ